MPTPGVVFDKIDALLETIRNYAVEPEFSNKVRDRERQPNYELEDNDVLRTMIELIAFSQGTRADRIGAMRERGVFRDVFGSFNPAAVARMDPEQIKKSHWSGKLSPMRFPGKIDKMVESARSLHDIAKRNGSFMQLLKSAHIPARIASPADIDAFWGAFEVARSNMPPFFQNFISLCHLLQTFRLPCAKPDKVIMSVAAELGIVGQRKQYGEPDLRNVVHTMQTYAMERRMSVPMVDLIFLIHGKQTWAKTLVRPSCYTA